MRALVPRLPRHAVPAVLALLLVLPAAAAAQSGAGPDRGGFTLLVGVGVGIQTDTVLDGSEVGVAGLNLGVGGFVRDNLAVLFRVSGTTARYSLADVGVDFGFTQTSGVAGASVQYWATDRLSFEVGSGVGFWDIGGASDRGVGLILGSALTLLNRGKHALQVGVEYAPAFTDPGTIHNLGVTIGYQFL